MKYSCSKSSLGSGTYYEAPSSQYGVPIHHDVEYVGHSSSGAGYPDSHSLSSEIHSPQKYINYEGT